MSRWATVLGVALALLPSRIHVWVRRHRGDDIDKTARIRFGTVIVATRVQVGAHTTIGPFALVRATHFALGDRSIVRPFTSLAAYDIELGKDCAFASFSMIAADPEDPRAKFRMGDHSQIFPFCWLDPGHGIYLGDRVGIGGHGLIFTHGSWSNYFRGAPVSTGPVRIEDRVWLPWRVFVMPNVVIGDSAIIGAGSVVTRSVPAGALAAGSPAAVLRPSAYAELDDASLRERAQEAVSNFLDRNPAHASLRIDATLTGSDDEPPADIVLGVNLDPAVARERLARGISSIDLVTEDAWIAPNSVAAMSLVGFLTRYGVRADRREA